MTMLKESSDTEDFPSRKFLSKEAEVEEGTEHTGMHTEHTTSMYSLDTVHYYEAIQLKL